ncbi:MAG: hypothetical protein KTV68_13475 [Acidimicrobiia bacterium]|nr:hypothetical protein [Acidimicrobiia bacterium]MCY4434129.1 DUF6527 family protein [bacterium]
MPETHEIGPGELWISLKHRTINLRCPCGCGDLTVLSLHPSRWHIHFDGKTVSLKGPTGGSVWANSGCGSHYFIKNSTVIWSHRIDPDCHAEYEHIERKRLSESQQGEQRSRPWLAAFRRLSPRKWRD